MVQEARSRCLRNRKPHPCGYFGDAQRECRCSQRQILKYRNKISGPLLDRIDIHIEVPSMAYHELSALEMGEASIAIRERATVARERQRLRFEGNGGVHCNSDMGAKQVQTHCQPVPAAQEMLKMAISELHFSARAYDRILKVSRTIADLEGSETIETHHITEAIQYRSLDRQLWA